jgi:hypothetical protein
MSHCVDCNSPVAELALTDALRNDRGMYRSKNQALPASLKELPGLLP